MFSIIPLGVFYNPKVKNIWQTGISPSLLGTWCVCVDGSSGKIDASYLKMLFGILIQLFANFFFVDAQKKIFLVKNTALSPF